MNQFFLGIFLLCNLSAFSQSEADCMKFHTGAFKFPDPKFKDIEVKRTGNWQSETDATDRSEIAGSIEWISPCAYVLTFKTQKNSNAEHMMGKKITTEILEIKGNECKVRFTLEGADPMEIMMVKTE